MARGPSPGLVTMSRSSRWTQCLYGHPAVLEAAVVGKPDDVFGEVPVAFVATKPGLAVTPADLLAHCSAALARYKVPSQIHVRTELPKNSVGSSSRVSSAIRRHSDRTAPRSTPGSRRCHRKEPASSSTATPSMPPPSPIPSRCRSKYGEHVVGALFQSAAELLNLLEPVRDAGVDRSDQPGHQVAARRRVGVVGRDHALANPQVASRATC